MLACRCNAGGDALPDSGAPSGVPADTGLDSGGGDSGDVGTVGETGAADTAAGDTGVADTGEPWLSLTGAPSPLGLMNGLNTVSDDERSLEEIVADLETGVVVDMLELGMGTSRVHDQGYVSFSWSRVDPERDLVALDFSRTDAIVALACRHGLSVLPTTGPAPRDASGVLEYLPDGDAFYLFLAEMFERYDGDAIFTLFDPLADIPDEGTREAIQACPITHWMMGNEPDIASDTDDWYTPEEYAHVLSLARQAAAAVAPQARILFGGLSWRSSYEPECWDFYEQVLQALQGDMFHEMAVHLHPEDLDTRNMLDQLDKVSASLPEGTPIWITELGISAQWSPYNRTQDHNASELSQARQMLLIQMALQVRGGRPALHGAIQMEVDACPHFDGTQFVDPEGGFRRLAWYSYRFMGQWMAQADLDHVWALVEGDEQGRYLYQLPLQDGGVLYLLVYDPGSLDGYRASDELDEDPRTFALTGLEAGEVQVWQGVPGFASGEEIAEYGEDLFPVLTLGGEAGRVEVAVGTTPVWVRVGAG